MSNSRAMVPFQMRPAARIRPARRLLSLSAVVLLVGCYDLTLKPYTGGDGGRDEAGSFNALDAQASTGGSTAPEGTGGIAATGGKTGVAGAGGAIAGGTMPVARLSAVVGMAAAQVARLQVARLPAVRFPVAARVAAAVMLACQTPLLLSRMSPLVDRAAVVRAPVEGEAPGAAASRPSGQDRTALPWRASRTAQSPSRQEPPVPRRHIPARPDTSSPEQRRAPAKAMAPGAGRRPPAPW